MSYQKMIKWNKKHPTGTKQPVIMHTHSGFWPSHSFLQEWIKYKEETERAGGIALDSEAYYKSQLR